MAAIEDWLVEQGLGAQDLAGLLDEFCDRLVSSGIHLLRGNASLAVVDPLIRARTHTWFRSRGVASNAIPHEREGNQFEASPFAAMMRDGLTMRHWRIETDGRPFAVFNEITALGGVDYLAVLHPFESPDFQGLRGVGLAFSTDRPGGLTEAETVRILELTRIFAVACYRITLRDIAVALMDAYVGAPASRRILNGQVRRGSGEPIEAVLLLADLSGFTSVADTSGLDLIGRLDEHLEAMAAPVISRGGSVLKFMGDGMLAVFPVNDDLTKAEACKLAVEASVDAIEKNTAVNVLRHGERPLHLDIALNYGEVFYGNVGAPGRLDFTVIGPAVNEVSRMEGFCGPLRRNLVISHDVASNLDRKTTSLGLHRLRGIEAERELFTLVLPVGEREG